ncbi:Rid family hydrolase [Chitinophaga sp. GCM10012297]|uniref:RidA family protein n=1 Tax=Chitinophaga chungangae TaxID=2821488 RepID=A0ABS3YGG0_9BACT|nr:RidA family protein [Chitinophaga chungangae]MBO9153765.1 RidA family protein [Chitinophaga chungangae]
MKNKVLLLSALWLVTHTVCSAQAISDPLLRYVPDGYGNTGAVIVEEAPLAHTALILPLNETGQLAGKDDPRRQIAQVFANLSRALESAGATEKDIIKLNVCTASAQVAEEVREEIARRFPKLKTPATSFIIHPLPRAGALLGIDAVAISSHRGEKVRRWPQAAVLPKGGVVYISGMAADGRVREAAGNTLQQLHATLRFLGLNKEHVVQIRAFMDPVDSAGLVEAEIKKFFSGGTMPPVIYAGWKSAKPLVEIELIAASPVKNKALIEYITPAGATASPVYSKVCRVNHGKKIYLSGLYGMGNDQLVQLQTVFDRLRDMMEKCGSDLQHLAKALYYVSDADISKGLTDIRKKYYNPERPPAATKAVIRQPGPDGSRIMIDMIGVQP